MTALRAVAAALAGAVAPRLPAARRTALAHPGDPAGLLTDDGVRLHVEVAGRPGASLTVVLVDGFAARWSMWDAQVARPGTVAGAGHMVPLTHADVVTPALLDLLPPCWAADRRRTP